MPKNKRGKFHLILWMCLGGTMMAQATEQEQLAQAIKQMDAAKLSLQRATDRKSVV